MLRCDCDGQFTHSKMLSCFQISFITLSSAQFTFQLLFDREVVNDDFYVVQVQGFVYPLGATGTAVSPLRVLLTVTNAAASLNFSTSESRLSQVQIVCRDGCYKVKNIDFSCDICQLYPYYILCC